MGGGINRSRDSSSRDQTARSSGDRPGFSTRVRPDKPHETSRAGTSLRSRTNAVQDKAPPS